VDTPVAIIRHKSIRLPDFDYSSASTYFFTVCTAERTFFFGDIEDGNMFLTRTGIQAWVEWDMTLQIRREIIEHAFVVMPNHIHGLVSIDANQAQHDVASHGNATRFQRRPRSLSTLVSGYKGAVTRWVRQEVGNPTLNLWQVGYHEHIVRNDGSFETIFGYIVNNPVRWSEDRENPANREAQ
jgi:putative transposase